MNKKRQTPPESRSNIFLFLLHNSSQVVINCILIVILIANKHKTKASLFSFFVIVLKHKILILFASLQKKTKTYCTFHKSGLCMIIFYK